MFFMVADNVRKHPELYEEVIRRGHKVGNHTYHHLGSFRHWALTYAVDVTKLTPYLHTPYFRPPHGCCAIQCIGGPNSTTVSSCGTSLRETIRTF